ncbi:MAG: hypothetical protein HY820_14230 [Acidobacteria bacterium]|nr:hypothetical protein [Acidobacteriota bacterium]
MGVQEKHSEQPEIRAEQSVFCSFQPIDDDGTDVVGFQLANNNIEQYIWDGDYEEDDPRSREQAPARNAP